MPLKIRRPRFVCPCGLLLYPASVMMAAKFATRDQPTGTILGQNWAHQRDQDAHLLLTNDPDEYVDFEMLLPAEG